MTYCRRMNHLPVIGDPIRDTEHRFLAAPMNEERETNAPRPSVRGKRSLESRGAIHQWLGRSLRRCPDRLVNLEEITDIGVKPLRQRHHWRDLQGITHDDRSLR